MSMILDMPSSISAPNSLALFDDTGSSAIWYAAKIWSLDTVNGQPAISYYEDVDSNIAFLQMIFAPWFDQAEYDSVKKQATAQGRTLNAVPFLGKSDSGKISPKLKILAEFPDDELFRFKVNGGNGGFLANKIPVVVSMNVRTGKILKGIIQTKGIGLVLEYSAVIKGATSSFEADITIDYDKTYEKLATRVSWNWYWSGDIQAAWQTLTETGAVKVKILGGTADQKTIIYKTAEFMREIFFKSTVSTVTTPEHPRTGIVNTSLQYEKIHEHKVFTLEFRERDFTEAPYICAAFTGQHNVSSIFTHTDPLTASLYEQVIGGGNRVDANYIPVEIIRGLKLLSEFNIDIT